MNHIFDNPIAILTLCIIAYQFGLFIYRKTKLQFLNPLFIAILCIIFFMRLFDLSLETFNRGSAIITMLLCPATMMLAVPIYRQRATIKKNLFPIAMGTFLGSVSSMGSIYFICKFLDINDKIAMSLLPKSTTTPIAIEISGTLGGIPSLTVASVILTGILGSILFPPIIKRYKLKNSIASGIAIGTASHAIGSARAVEIGETEAALAGIAVGIAGLISVLIALFI